MLPLSGSTLPSSALLLAEAIREGLLAHALTPREVAATGGTWPSLELLRLDLTDAKIDLGQRLFAGQGALEGRVTSERFELVASPIECASAPIELALRAQQAVFAFDHSTTGEAMLTLTGVRDGELSLECSRQALESLLLQIAKKAASEHGADIKKVTLTLRSRSPRSLAFSAEVTAKMFVTAAVTVSGLLEIDEQLVAQLSELRFSGDGIIGKAAGGFIRPQLAKFEGRSFSLMSLGVGAIKLRDVQISGGESLRISAQFAS